MRVRSGIDGDWLPLRPLDGLPEGGVRAMCGPDVGAMLELDEALPVVAWGPWPRNAGAGVDAVCLTADGNVELVVATHGEEARDTLWRLVEVASSLEGTTPEAFVEHCTELEAGVDLGSWLHRRCGADGDRAVARLRESLATGEFGVVVLTPGGAGTLAQPLALLARAATRIRTFTVQVMRAGQVYAVDAALEASTIAVDPVDGPRNVMAQEPVAHEPDAYEPAAHEPAAHEPPAHEPPAPEPAGHEPVAHETATQEPAAHEATAHYGDETAGGLQITASDEAAFLAGVDRLDHRTSAHLRWLHAALGSLVEELEYTTDGELVHVTGWRDGHRRLPLYGLDSQGLLQLALTTLPAEEQLEFAGEVAALLHDDSDAATLLDAGFAEVDVPACLDDQSLLEYLVDNLVEALPGGRESFGTQPQGGAGEDYFQDLPPAGDPTAGGDELGRDAA